MGNLEGKVSLRQQVSSIPQQIIQTQQEILDDDLRGIQNFGTAFSEARKRGLKQFRWGKGVYGTQLAQKVNTPGNINLRPLPKPESSENGLSNMQNYLQQGNEYNSYKWKNKKDPLAYKRKSWRPDIIPYRRENGVSAQEVYEYRASHPQYYYQKGGTMNNQQELQKAFMAYLIQDAQAQGIQIQSEQDLQAYAQQLGEDGIKAKYQEFMQKMQGGVMAKFGAKLQYYKKLKGVCPEGEELVYFKQGGRICKACQKAQTGSKVEEPEKKMNEVQKFKQKQNKEIGKNKCGKKLVKRKK